MSKTVWWILGLGGAGAAVYFLTRKTTAQKRQYLIDTFQNEPPAPDTFRKMSDDEIEASYTLVVDYFLKNKTLPEGSPLKAKMLAISQKYGIFT